MKYDAQISGLKAILPSAKSVLIAIPTGANIDKLAAGLSLYLSLTQQGKEVTILCEDTLRVGQAHLFAIDKIKQTLPSTSGSGNLILSLEGVEIMEENGRLTPKALEKLDWHSDKNGTLNLVFHVLPGQNFQPSRIVPRYSGAGFDVIFVLGSQSLTNLGNLYNQNPQAFSNSQLVNIDNQAGNTNFGQTNVIDPGASSIAEIMTYLMPDLGLFMDGDMATNLLAGMFEATNNLTNEKAGPDIFEAVAIAMRAGGRKPQPPTATTQGGLDLSALVPQNNPAANQPGFPAIPQDQGAQRAIPVEPQPVAGQPLAEATHPVMDPNLFIPQPENPNVGHGHAAPAQPAPPHDAPSPEEVPAEEAATSTDIEPDWLTPKIFKGTSIG